MASNVKDYSRTASGNGFSTAAGGMPEGMDRRDVNDAARVRMKDLRDWYEDPGWVDLISEDGGYTITRDSDTTFSVEFTAAGDIDAESKFPADARVRIGDGSTFVEGFITSSNFVLPDTIVVCELDGGAVIQNTPTTVDTHALKDTAERTAYHPTGTTTGQIPPHVPTIDDLGDGATLDQGHGNGFDADTVDGAHLEDIYAVVGHSSMLVNSDFAVWQRGTTINNASPQFKNDNGEYIADQWVLLMGDGATKPTAGNGTADVSVNFAEFPAGVSGVCMEVAANANTSASPSAEKIGFLQMIEARDVLVLQNKTVSISFRAKNDAGALAVLQVALIEFTGTPDTIPSIDIVSNWNAEGAEPSLVTDFTMQSSVGAGGFSMTNTWQEFTLENLTIGASTVNLGVMIWVDDQTYSSGDTFYLTGVNLTRGQVKGSFAQPLYDDNFRNCTRYFRSTFEDTTAPAVGDDVGITPDHGGFLVTNGLKANNINAFSWRFDGPMLRAPDMLLYNPVRDNSGNNAVELDGGDDVSGVDFSAVSTKVSVYITQDPSDNTNENELLGIHATADATL